MPPSRQIQPRKKNPLQLLREGFFLVLTGLQAVQKHLTLWAPKSPAKESKEALRHLMKYMHYTQLCLEECQEGCSPRLKKRRAGRVLKFASQLLSLKEHILSDKSVGHALREISQAGISVESRRSAIQVAQREINAMQIAVVDLSNDFEGLPRLEMPEEYLAAVEVIKKHALLPAAREIAPRMMSRLFNWVAKFFVG